MSVNEVNEALVRYMKTEKGVSPSLLLGSSFDKGGTFDDIFLLNQLSEEGIPYTLFQQIQEAGPLLLQEWAVILGISSKTLTRYRKMKKTFQPWHSSVILEITELLTIGLEVFGDRDRLYSWLVDSSYALGGRSPMSLLSNAYGRELVMRELTHIEYGIFA